MIKGKIVVTNPSGLHLRPAGLLCREAMRFKSQISIYMNDCIANAKSVLSVLGACVKCGDEILLVCQGEDEEEAFLMIKELIESGLEEE
ncbi:MAG: HPr family phosphocarrier protein [Clostridiales bacterium]|nr:HPr family phosphocarrier protein [Clostridiales bacterium]MDY3747270.1 HPr family phosphocarrier protein [Lachnospiraceae bacterium]